VTVRLVPTLLARSHDGPTLVVGPSLGTSVRALWADVAAALSGRATVVGWDLPGHGESPDAEEELTVADLATALADLVGVLRAAGDLPEGPLVAAGVSLGGAVTLQAALDHPGLFAGVAALCTAARIGEPADWLERSATVAAAGTPTMVPGSAQRWFAPGFVERAPDVTTRLLRSLQDADRLGYARCCRALAGYDVRGRLGELAVPLLVVAGADDVACPPDAGRFLAEGAQRGTLRVLPGVAHLAPAEAPARVAELLEAFMRTSPADSDAHVGAHDDPGAGAHGSAPRDPVATPDPYAAGMVVRRQVLGDAHVDRASAAVDDLTRDFQELITRYAWGSIWTRPGLDRVTRSAITLTALIAGHHWDELRLHLHAALRNGMTRDQIREVLLQSAVYCSVPSANTAFKIAAEELAETPET
jgi:3-oxoadipate enol-lactonase / 4-carboxymuconolactone decarboxylase